MAMTVAERQQKHRAKSEGSTLVTARTASEKVKRFLLKYPEEVRAVDQFMMSRAAIRGESERRKQWLAEHPNDRMSSDEEDV